MASNRPARKVTSKSTKAKVAKESKSKVSKVKDTKPKVTKRKTATPKKTKTDKKTVKSTPKKTKNSKTDKKSDKKNKKDTKKTVKSVKKTKKETKTEKPDTAIVIEEVVDDLESLFKNHVSKELLVELLLCNNVKVPSSSKKEIVVEKLMETTMSKGQQVVIDRLKKASLSAFVEEVKGSEASSPNNKGELQKELRELIVQAGGFDEAVKKLKVETVDAICEDLGFKEDGTRKEKVSGLADETRLLGAKSLFDRVLYTFLKELCGKIGLSTKGQKEHLVARFLGQSYRFLLDEAKVPAKEAKKEKKEKSDKKEKKTKPKDNGPDLKKIKKGISDLDLYQYYTNQLEEYMKEKELKKGKNKKEMVKIIQSFLEGDESVLKKNQVKKDNKRKRKAESTDNEPNKKQKTEEETTSA